MNEIIFEMAKIGMRHATIASSLGLTLHTLRKFFVRELLNAALEAEIDSCLRRKSKSPPKPDNKPAAPPSKPKLDRVVFRVYNNDGEPNEPC